MSVASIESDVMRNTSTMTGEIDDQIIQHRANVEKFNRNCGTSY